jgi:hypothetical protein
MLRLAVPELVTLTLSGMPVVPWVMVEKKTLPGKRVTAEVAETPVPLTDIDCGLPGALSVAVREAWRGPLTEGVKTKLTGQLAFGRRTAGGRQEGAGDAEKSAAFIPVSDIALTLRDWLPVFTRLTIRVMLDWPTVDAPKSKEAGKRTATGPLDA